MLPFSGMRKQQNSLFSRPTLQTLFICSGIVVFTQMTFAQTKNRAQANSSKKTNSVYSSQKQPSSQRVTIAQNSSQPAPQLTTTAESQAPAKFSGSLSADYYISGGTTDENPERQELIEYTLTGKYAFTQRLSLGFATLVDQERTGQKRTLMDDTTVPLTYKGYEFNQTTYLRHVAALILPTNQQSRDKNHHQGGLRLGTGINTTLWDMVDLGYLFAVQRSHHQLDPNSPEYQKQQETLLKWQIRHRIDYGVRFTESFSLRGQGVYIEGITYSNDYPDQFLIDTSLSYSFAQRFSFTVGTGNTGNAYKDNGVDSNVNVYDSKSNYHHAGFGVTF